MVRKYKRKSNRAPYGEDRLNEAVNAVSQGQLTMSMALFLETVKQSPVHNLTKRKRLVKGGQTISASTYHTWGSTVWH